MKVNSNKSIRLAEARASRRVRGIKFEKTMKTISHDLNPEGWVSIIREDGILIARFFGDDAKRNAEKFYALDGINASALIGAIEALKYYATDGAGYVEKETDAGSIARAALAELKGDSK